MVLKEKEGEKNVRERVDMSSRKAEGTKWYVPNNRGSQGKNEEGGREEVRRKVVKEGARKVPPKSGRIAGGH